MFVDTHCHLNIMAKKKFDVPLSLTQLKETNTLVLQAEQKGVSTIINVGTSLVESHNCIALAQQHRNVYATVGIHPCDLKSNYKKELKELEKFLKKKKKIKLLVLEK